MWVVISHGGSLHTITILTINKNTMIGGHEGKRSIEGKSDICVSRPVTKFQLQFRIHTNSQIHKFRKIILFHVDSSTVINFVFYFLFKIYFPRLTTARFYL